MQRFWESVYSIFLIPALWASLHVLGLFNPKVRRGILGRKRLFQELRDQVSRIPPGQRIWIHSSSLGEFEQAKPIIARLKQLYPDVRIVVTFFSPSGYEHSRSYPLADAVSYIPFDTRSAAQRFLDLVTPDIAVMVRYDIWPNHIWELSRRGIPVCIANATMRRGTLRRFPFVRVFHRHVYNSMQCILTVSEADRQTFNAFGLDRPTVSVVGDTRYDQVSIRSRDARRRNLIPSRILQSRKVFVVGSSWPEDEDAILPAFLQLQDEISDAIMILVPHEPSVDHLEVLEERLSGKAKTIRFSALNEYRNERIIIVDSVGLLLVLYAYAHIAYVGGSFRQGVHNVLEAAVYGIPVIFGPRHWNSQEPVMLLERGGGFVVPNTQELARTLRNLLLDDQARAFVGERAASFVQAHVGATARCIAHLEPYLGPPKHAEGSNQ
jgi:3-deoxy-D-manno-octulosonic-acid transferase